MPTLNARVDFRPLGYARIAFGVVVLLRTTPLLSFLDIPFLHSVSPLLGWPPDGWHVAAFGIALPDTVVAALCIVRTVAAIAFCVGVRARIAGVVAGVSGYLVVAQDVFGYTNTSHLLCVASIVLALGNAGCAVALLPDRALSPASGRWLVRALVVSVYAWSGIAKLNATWLSGEALAQFHADGFVRGALGSWLVATSSLRIVVACAVAMTELALGPLLLWTRTRRVALLVALGFHVVVETVVHPDVLGWAMAALLFSFWDRQGHEPDHAAAAAAAGQTTSP